MDGVEELVGVTVIGATNRPEVLVRWTISPKSPRHRHPPHLDIHSMLRVRIRR